jgi:uncharacterized RDD family membrane protein YckC
MMPAMAAEQSELEYVGFWARVLASIIDSILVVIVTVPLLRLLYGRSVDFYGTRLDYQSLSVPHGFLFDWVLPAVAVIAFWIARQATPGKMVIGARIVDARTGGKISTGQAIGRYLGYYLSTVVFFLGFLWIAFDPRKQGWHDKLAGTVVVRSKRGLTEPVRFPGQ